MARIEAQRVEQELQIAVERLEALDPAHPHVGYLAFSSLYLCTMRAWLDILETEEKSRLALQVIPRFFALYRHYVLDQMDAPLSQIAPHWRSFHRFARTRRGVGMLFVAIWAHIYHDLGVAIRQVEEVYGPAGLSHHSLHSSGLARMFGPKAIRAFGRATDTFYASPGFYRLSQTNAQCSVSQRLLLRVLYGMRGLWLPGLYLMRLSSYLRAKTWARPGYDCPRYDRARND